MLAVQSGTELSHGDGRNRGSRGIRDWIQIEEHTGQQRVSREEATRRGKRGSGGEGANPKGQRKLVETLQDQAVLDAIW